jgi:hypothetical protein
MKTRKPSRPVKPAAIEITPHVAAMIRGDIECVAATIDEAE